jgi:hypothetical protein
MSNSGAKRLRVTLREKICNFLFSLINSALFQVTNAGVLGSITSVGYMQHPDRCSCCLNVPVCRVHLQYAFCTILILYPSPFLISKSSATIRWFSCYIKCVDIVTEYIVKMFQIHVYYV